MTLVERRTLTAFNVGSHSPKASEWWKGRFSSFFIEYIHTMDMVSTSLNICQFCNLKFSPAKTAPYQKYCSRRCNWRNWQLINKDHHNQQVREYRQRRSERDGHWRDEGQKAKSLKQWMIELKSQPCLDCKQSFDTCCMDFDHRVGTEKKYNIGSMFAHHYSKELIQQELDKCDLVCANCHRIRTKHRRLGSKNKLKILLNGTTVH